MEEFAIYGVGFLGRSVADKIRECSNLRVTHFIDANARNGQIVSGISVAAPGVESVKGIDVLMAVLNNGFDVTATVTKLMDLGARSVRTPPQVFHLLGDRGCFWEWYWLSTSRNIRANDPLTRKKFESSFFDAQSRDLYKAICDYRLFGNSELLPTPLPFDDQYLETGIEGFWEGDVRLVDCGAYVGDSIEKLKAAGVSITTAWAFEPDPYNYRKLQAMSLSTSTIIHTYPIATSDRRGVTSFDARSADGSAFSNAGNLTVPIMPVDDVIPFDNVTHVKFDVEGAEMATLQGMERLLKRCKPKLAISAYHRPDDIEDLVDFAVSTYGAATLSLRTFAHQTFETVLYVVPDSRVFP